MLRFGPLEAVMKHFSLLDLSPIPEGKTAADALKNTMELAQAAESFGFHRYWLAEHHWGKGIASEATSKMTDYVFAETEIVRIAALVYSPNTASMKVLEKCGYRLEAIRQKAGFKHGVFLDEHAFVKFRPYRKTKPPFTYLAIPPPQTNSLVLRW